MGSVDVQVPQASMMAPEVMEAHNSSNSNIMTIVEYQEAHWGRLREAIDKMFTHPPGSYRPISYEEMYSAVYKCVCKQYSEKLYQDLINHVMTTVAEWSKHMQQVSDDQMIEEFHKSLVQFFHALGGIVPIFTYMNRFYIETKLNTTLRSELLRVFSSMFSDIHVERLIPLMTNAQTRPFSVHPERMASICKYLFQLNPEYCKLQPSLFQHYLPNVGPAMTEEDLEKQKAEEQIFQARLRAEGWNTHKDTRRKREFEEELPPSLPSNTNT